MKNLIYFCGMSLLACTTLSSCLFEEDDIFDESAALRGQHYTEKINSVLYTPENGWVMQYFPKADTKGYNMFTRFFENGTVILTSDHEYMRNHKSGTLESDTSTFVINEQDGPVLSFNSWNDILSVFTDPVDPETLAEDGKGLEGDNEFVVMKVNDDDIIMRGERHDAEVRLLKCDRPMDEFIAAVRTTEEDVLKTLLNEFFLISNVDGKIDTIFTYDLGDGVFDFTNLQGKDRVDRSLAYVCTPTGVRFQSVFDFEYYTNQGTDTTFWICRSHEFTYTDDKNAMVSEDGAMTFIPNWAGYACDCVNNQKKNQVTFQQTEGDATWQQLCADLNTAIKAAYSTHSLMQISFGFSSESGAQRRFGLCFKTTSKVVAGIEGTATVDGDVITFNINTESVSNSMTTYVKKGLADSFNAVANYLNGSWKMTCDRTFTPKNITLTSTADASKSILLTLK